MSLRLLAFGVLAFGFALSYVLVSTAQATDITCSSCMLSGGDCGTELGGPAGTRGCGYLEPAPCGDPCDRCEGELDSHVKLCMNVGDEVCHKTGEADCGNKKTKSCVPYSVGPAMYCKCPNDGGDDNGECDRVPTCN